MARLKYKGFELEVADVVLEGSDFVTVRNIDQVFAVYQRNGDEWVEVESHDARGGCAVSPTSLIAVYDSDDELVDCFSAQYTDSLDVLLGLEEPEPEPEPAPEPELEDEE